MFVKRKQASCWPRLCGCRLNLPIPARTQIALATLIYLPSQPVIGPLCFGDHDSVGLSRYAEISQCSTKMSRISFCWNSYTSHWHVISCRSWASCSLALDTTVSCTSVIYLALLDNKMAGRRIWPHRKTWGSFWGHPVVCCCHFRLAGLPVHV